MSVFDRSLGLLNFTNTTSPWFKPDTRPRAYKQPEEQAKLIVTDELNGAIRRCKERVQRIKADCHKRNRRFRDIEFDLEEDQQRCLHGLTIDEACKTLDALRVKEIFEKPSFSIDGYTASDLIQGRLSDCWFLSALATVSTVPDLINKICVDCDPEVGVYGFIFYRDAGWVDVIVDDLLFIHAPKFEELEQEEQYHFKSNKATYNTVARKGSESLYFASSGTEGETWVPLIEKAFAKLHGDYAALNRGWSCEAVESLTGGVSNCFYLHDIFNVDKFWKEELLKLKKDAEKDSVFSCVILNPSSGLLQDHSYSIMEAIEYKDKRFLKIRNPWGKGEWNGPWSDGSKEWTPEWMEAIGHTFGDDGEFVMQYEDFLATWTYVDRTRLFDDSWMLSSLWLNVLASSLPCAWSFGDVSFTIRVEQDTPAIIVLSRLDDRHFQELSGCFQWSLDFTVYKLEGDEPIGTSTHERLWRRSVNLEIELEKGDYVVHVRLDRKLKADALTDIYHGQEGVFRPHPHKDHALSVARKQPAAWDIRKLGRKWAGANDSRQIATNFEPERYGAAVSLDQDLFTGRDLTKIQKDIEERPIADRDNSATHGDVIPDHPTTNGHHHITPMNKEPASTELKVDRLDKAYTTNLHVGVFRSKPQAEIEHKGFACNICNTSPIVGTFYRCMDCDKFDICSNCMSASEHSEHIKLRVTTAADANRLKDDIHGRATHPEDYEVILGLRVYTKKEAPATIAGQLRQGNILRGCGKGKRKQ